MLSESYIWKKERKKRKSTFEFRGQSNQRPGHQETSKKGALVNQEWGDRSSKERNRDMEHFVVKVKKEQFEIMVLSWKILRWSIIFCGPWHVHPQTLKPLGPRDFSRMWNCKHVLNELENSSLKVYVCFLKNLFFHLHSPYLSYSGQKTGPILETGEWCL